MKFLTNIKEGSRLAWSPYRLAIKSLIGGALILTAFQASAQTQDVQYTRPSWYFGAAAGANLNFYRGTTQELNSTLSVPTAFHDGFGVGLYLAPLVEFHRPDTRFGAMLQLGYDNRSAVFNGVTTPCNCPADLSTDLTYFTVEPSLRFAPFCKVIIVLFATVRSPAIWNINVAHSSPPPSNMIPAVTPTFELHL